jgi:glycosyltransferase involved in cell wall biosynthesis
VEWGGGEGQVLLLVRALTAAGIETSLWAKPRGALYERARRSGLALRALPSGWRLPWGARSLASTLEGEGADLIHCHDSGALGLGLRLRRRLGIPLVLARRIASPLRRNPVSKAKYSARRIEAVVAVSGAVRDVMIGCGFPRERIFVVPSGVDVGELDAETPDEHFRKQQRASHLVAGIGKLSRKKNWSFLIQTAAVVHARGVDVVWVLVGDGPERKRLEAEARDRGVASRVRFLGFRDDAVRILKSCDALFFPSLREGTPGVVRDAMVLGVPVVAVESAGTTETLSGHGWLVAPDDPGGAARALTEALTDSSKRQAMCREARRSAVARFALEQTLHGTLDVYASVLSGLLRDQRRS